MQTRMVKLSKLQDVIALNESMMAGKQTYSMVLQQLKQAEDAAKRSGSSEVALSQAQVNAVMSVLRSGLQGHREQVTGLMTAMFDRDISEIDTMTPRSKLSVFKFPVSNPAQSSAPAAATSSTLKIVPR